MNPEDVKVVRRRDDLLQGPSFGARCIYCRKWITKYDHSEADALANAVSDSHDCLHLHDPSPLSS